MESEYNLVIADIANISIGWNDFLKLHPTQSTVFHTSEWMETLYEAFGYKPKVLLATSRDSSVIGAVPFMVDSRYGIENYLSMPYDTYGGYIGVMDIKLKLLYDFLMLPGFGVRYYVDYNLVMQSQGTIITTEIMDISQPSQTIFENLHKANRTAIKSALKHAVTIRDTTNYVTIFDKVPKVLVDSIIRNMVPSGLCKIYLAEIDGMVVAASIFFIYGDMMMYWANTTTDLGRKINANYLLLWTAIQCAKERGCTKFNFGASPPDAESLVKFKKSWGTKPHYYLKNQKNPVILKPIIKFREVFYG